MNNLSADAHRGDLPARSDVRGSKKQLIVHASASYILFLLVSAYCTEQPIR